MQSFLIGRPEVEYVSVHIAGRSHAASRDYWDGNWLTADIEIDAGGFRGRFGADFRTDELSAFRDALAHLQSFVSRRRN